MSTNNQEYNDRFNTYKGRLDSAVAAVIRVTQYLVRPTEGFPTHSHAEIGAKWSEWRDEEQCFWKMTSSGIPPVRHRPLPPQAGAPPPCFHMWGLLIQAQVDGTHGKIELLRQIVAEIVADDTCSTHPASCPCKVPDHYWVYKEDVEALAPLKLRHSPNCQCAGHRSCAERNEANRAAIAALNVGSTQMTRIQAA